VAHKPYGTNIFITGASSGIGLACALLFASHGYQVWGVSRSGICAEPLPDTIHLSRMDVTDVGSVETEVTRIWHAAKQLTGDGIGTVIHCAGFGIGGSAEDTPLEAVRNQFETNYFGVLQVNQCLLPRMRSRGPSLVIILGSVAGRLSIPFQSHYSSTKFALEAYVEALRMEGKPFGIQATILEAGDTKTPFTAQRQMAVPEGSPYRAMAAHAIAKMEHDEQHGYAAETVARKALQIAQKKHPPLRKPVGAGYMLLLLFKRVLPDRLAETIISRMYLSDKPQV